MQANLRNKPFSALFSFIIKMMSTVQERVENVSLFFPNNNSDRAAINVFKELHLNSHVYHTYVGGFLRKFQDPWQRKKRIIENSIRTEVVLGHIVMEL